jgi:AcrR family transcriptional regulator
MKRAKAAEDKHRASARIRSAALELFTGRGYHGTSVRELAQAVGIETASLYYHYPSKQAILADLFDQTMEALLQGLAGAIDSGATPEQRLREAVRFHVMFHITRQDEAFLSHSELRSLSPANRRRIIAGRDRYERMLRELLAEGVVAGVFDIPDISMATTAILMMSSGVSDWFRPKGRLKPVQVAERYANMVMRLVANPAAARARKPSAKRGAGKSAK